MRVIVVIAAIAALVTAGCEDGPDRVFTPNDGDPTEQNGYSPQAPFTQEGDKKFAVDPEEDEFDDSDARAQFCNEEENEDVIQEMVVQPIIPDVSIGGVPMWRPDGTPTHADDLIGRPENGKFCDPDVYSNALAWGPTNEVIMFIDEETKLIDYFAVTQDYKGTMGGTYTKVLEDGETEEIPIEFRLRERIKIGTAELDQYSSTEDEAERTNSWVNYSNINAMYRMIRETYFGAEPLDPDFNCVDAKICEVLYDADENQSVPQGTRLVFNDSGLQIPMSPEGHLLAVLVIPVKVAPFEVAAEYAFGDEDGNIDPVFTSLAKPGCNLGVAAGLTWGEFQSNCIESGDERTLSRVDYNVGGIRDSVFLSFNGVTLGFRQNSATEDFFEDGSSPGDDDILYSMTITQTVNGPVAEYRPLSLARVYKEKLEARLAASLHMPDGSPMDIPDDEDEAAERHPFLAYKIQVPESLSDEPSRLGTVVYDSPTGPRSWIADIIQDVNRLYDSLTPEERAMVDPRVTERVFAIEPWVDAVLEAVSYGEVNDEHAFKAFSTEDDFSWSFGYGHFVKDDVPYRITAQYNLNFAALTAIGVSAGFSPVDEIYNGWNNALREPPPFQRPYPYFTPDMFKMDPAHNPLALGGRGLSVKPETYDRNFDMMDVLVSVNSNGSTLRQELTLPGASKNDGRGYFRQIRGERSEFVPAWGVSLGGKETGATFWVEEELGDEGEMSYVIGRVSMSGYKGAVELCPGLGVRYGEDLRSKIVDYAETAGFTAYEACEIVFNYSDNGNVLDDVISLANRTGITAYAGRASAVAYWR